MDSTFKAAARAARAAHRSTEHSSEANRIAASAQRAWITIKAELRTAKVREGTDFAVFTIDLLFKNIGQTVARDVRIHGEFGQTDSDSYEGFRTMFETNNKLLVPTGATIIPGETRRYRIDSWYMVDALRRASVEKPFKPTVFAFCDYSIETDDGRRKSDSSFMLVKRDREDILDTIIPVDPLPDASEMEFEGGSITAT